MFRTLLALASIALAVGCGDDRSTPTDGSLPDGTTSDSATGDSSVPDSGTPDGRVDSGMQCGGNECDIITGDGCPIGQGCYFLSMGPGTEPMAICQPTGFGTDGDTCAGSAECQAGYTCAPGLGLCRKLCCFGDDSACPSGQRCSTQFVWMNASGETIETDGAFCSPDADCDPLAQTGCGTEACYTDITEDGTLLCAMAGTGAEGEACTALNDCAAGLYCRGSAGSTVCHRYCSVSAGTPCGVGQTCTGLGLPAPLDDLGICTPPS